MTAILPVLWLGFLLGMRHATDPDHVIAVSTIVSQHRSTRGAALIGAVWGLGHSLTIFAIGSGMILLGWVMPTRVGLSLEFGVALMLIGLGLATIRANWREAVAEHAHAHQHGAASHAHPHRHDSSAHRHTHDPAVVNWLDRRLAGIHLYQLSRPLLIGIVHGLAGSAAVALLVLATISDAQAGLLYLAVFGLGTVAGMMVVTAGISLPFALGVGDGAPWQRRLRLGTGLLSLAFGCFLAWRIGVTEGLFVSSAAG